MYVLIFTLVQAIMLALSVWFPSETKPHKCYTISITIKL